MEKIPSLVIHAILLTGRLAFPISSLILYLNGLETGSAILLGSVGLMAHGLLKLNQRRHERKSEVVSKRLAKIMSPSAEEVDIMMKGNKWH